MGKVNDSNLTHNITHAVMSENPVKFLKIRTALLVSGRNLINCHSDVKPVVFEGQPLLLYTFYAEEKVTKQQYDEWARPYNVGIVKP